MTLEIINILRNIPKISAKSTFICELKTTRKKENIPNFKLGNLAQVNYCLVKCNNVSDVKPHQFFVNFPFNIEKKNVWHI